MNQDFVRKVADYLILTFTSKEADQRLSAEKELQTLSLDTQNFFFSLIGIIGSESFENKLKLSAATNLRHFIRTNVDSAGLDLTTKIGFGDQIFQLMVSDGIQKDVKNLLGFALHPLLTIDQSEQSTEALAHFTPLISKALEGSVQQILGALRAIRSIFSGISQHSLMFGYAESLLSGSFVSIAEKAILQIQLGLQNTQEAMVVEACDLIHDWANTATTILEYFELTAKRFIMKFAESVQIAQVYSQILKQTLPDPLLGNTGSCINLSQTESHVQLNKAKSQVLQSINIVLVYLVDQKKKIAEESGKVNQAMWLVGMNVPDSPFTTMAAQIAPEIIVTLVSLWRTPNLDRVLDPDHISDLVVEMLLCLYRLAQESVYFPLFQNSFKLLIVNVCLVLLRITATEIENFNISPHEFVSFAQDVCERQESEVVKTCAAQLLETICERIDGAMTFAVHFLIQALDATLTGQDPSASNSHEFLTEFASTSLFLADTPETKLETSFVALSILSYSMSKRRDLMNLLESMLVHHKDALISTNNGVLQSRICLFMYFFTEYIFENNEEAFNKYLGFLLTCTNAQQIPRAVSIQACEALSFLIQEETILFRLEKHIPEILQSMILAIGVQKEKSFFDALLEVVQTFSEVITPEILQALVTELVKKILSEDSEKKDSVRDKNKIRIAKCWNILKSMSEAMEIIPKFRDPMEQLMIPLFEQMKNPSEWNFEDEIIQVLKNIIKKSQSITEIEMTIISQFPAVQAKYEDSLGPMFLALSHFIFYGKSILSSNLEAITMVTQMAMKALFAKPKGEHNEAIMGNGALLLQQILMTYKGVLDSLLLEILNAAASRLGMQIQNTFFYARLLGVFLASFNYNAAMTCEMLNSIKIIEDQSALITVIGTILQRIEVFNLAHDKKLAVLGICDILRLPSMPGEIASSLQHIFKALIQILSTKEDPTPAKMVEIGPTGERVNLMEFIMNDEAMVGSKTGLSSQLLQAGSNDKKEENESRLSVKQIVTPLQNFDEFVHFREVIDSIRTNSPNGLQQLVGVLDESEQKKLVEFLQTKRVGVGPRQTVMEDRRIVHAVRYTTSN